MDEQTKTQLIGLAIFGFKELLAAMPELYTEFADMFSREEPPTDEEWVALAVKLGGKKYKDYVPSTSLTDEELKANGQ